MGNKRIERKSRVVTKAIVGHSEQRRIELRKSFDVKMTEKTGVSDGLF
jgi:hypothetical protein